MWRDEALRRLDEREKHWMRVYGVEIERAALAALFMSVIVVVVVNLWERDDDV